MSQNEQPNNTSKWKMPSLGTIEEANDYISSKVVAFSFTGGVIGGRLSMFVGFDFTTII